MNAMYYDECDFGFSYDHVKNRYTFDNGKTWKAEASKEDAEDCMSFFVECHDEMTLDEEDLDRLEERLELLLGIY